MELKDAFHFRDQGVGGLSLVLRASYGCGEVAPIPPRIRPSEGLVGQCLVERRRIVITDVPPDYLKIGSALGEATPQTVVLQPAIFEGGVEAVLELDCLQRFSQVQFSLLDQLGDSLAVALHTIQSAQRTEDLLHESQSLAAKLEDNARQLHDRNQEVERKNVEVEEARFALQERAEQLSRSNADLEQFAYVASHDLQAPLNNISCFMGLLAQGYKDKLDPQAQEYIKIAEETAVRAQNLIRSLLSYAKIDTEKTHKQQAMQR